MKTKKNIKYKYKKTNKNKLKKSNKNINWGEFRFNN